MKPRHPRRFPDRSHAARRAGSALALVAGLLAAPAALSGQENTPTDRTALMTRPELESLAARAEQGGDQQRASAAALRRRLRDGDFRVGDKITLRTESTLNLPEVLAEALNGTHTLREGKTLRLPNISPDLSLDGVLRSELDSVVNTHLARSLRSVRVHADPALQVLISGPVGKPGYYPAEPDMLVTDVIMAVGPAGNADLRRSVIKRDGETIVSRDSLQTAIRNGATLDRLDFRSGDELAVGEKSTRNWMTYVSAIGALSGVAWLIVALTQ